MNSETLFRLSNVKNKESSYRFNWLDWMKAIGIGLITYGHFFSLFDIYVYVFNVPLFFVISGFLCKREVDSTTFWRKLWFNLIVPLIIICTINYIIGGVKVFFDIGRKYFSWKPYFILWKNDNWYTRSSRCFLVCLHSGLTKNLSSIHKKSIHSFLVVDTIPCFRLYHQQL